MKDTEGIQLLQPLISCLQYFFVLTTTYKRKEADIGINLEMKSLNSITLLLAVYLSLEVVHGFQQPLSTLPTASSTQLSISNLFNNNSNAAPQLPNDVKDAVSKCRAAVQKGLENRLSR